MDTLPVIIRIYEAYKHVFEINQHVIKPFRYGLGHSLEESILLCLDHSLMAKNAPKQMKAGYLIRALAQQEIAVLKLRLYLELQAANETKIFQAQALLEEIGRMLGGWLKSVQ